MASDKSSEDETGSHSVYYYSPAFGEPDGEPYGVLADLASSGEVPGQCPVRLPETIDGAAIAALLLVADNTTWAPLLLYCLPLATAALSVSVVQAYITWRIATDLVPYDETCTEGDFLLSIICLGVFIMVMVNDFKDVVSVHRWIQRLPVTPKHQMLRMQKFREEAIDADDKEVYTDGYCVNKVVTGITVLELCVAYSLLALKLVVLVALTWFGSGYLLRSPDNETLIMNSLALTFIIELGEYCYKFVSNADMQFLLDGMPVVGLSPKETHGYWGDTVEQLWPLLSFFLLAAIEAVVWHGWC